MRPTKLKDKKTKVEIHHRIMEAVLLDSMVMKISTKSLVKLHLDMP